LSSSLKAGIEKFDSLLYSIIDARKKKKGRPLFVSVVLREAAELIYMTTEELGAAHNADTAVDLLDLMLCSSEQTGTDSYGTTQLLELAFRLTSLCQPSPQRNFVTTSLFSSSLDTIPRPTLLLSRSITWPSTQRCKKRPAMKFFNSTNKVVAVTLYLTTFQHMMIK